MRAAVAFVRDALGKRVLAVLGEWGWGRWKTYGVYINLYDL